MSTNARSRHIRSRWAAVGAAVAVSLGAGGVGLSQAAIGTGEKPVFVSITPCRLIDTRGAVGPRTSPLGAGDTLTLQITGSTGECTNIPADAVGAAMNVTAIRPSTRSFLTVYPEDAALPNASNLNWNGGDPPTPNKVDVKLSPTGAVKMTNDAGTVHIAADLVGYYVDHHHDDRYYRKNQTYTRAQVDAAIAAGVPASEIYTKAEIDAALGLKADSADVYTKGEVDTALGGKANAADVYTQAQVDAAIAALQSSLTAVQTKRAAINETAFVSRDANDLIRRGFGQGGAYLASISGSDDGMMASIQLPDGARITNFTAHSFDDTNIGGENLTIRLQRLSHTSGSYTTVATVSTFAGGGVVADSTSLSHVVDNDAGAYHIFVTGAVASNRRIRTVEITYEITLP